LTTRRVTGGTPPFIRGVLFTWAATWPRGTVTASRLTCIFTGLVPGAPASGLPHAYEREGQRSR
jgi:hypothetical protein